MKCFCTAVDAVPAKYFVNSDGVWYLNLYDETLRWSTMLAERRLREGTHDCNRCIHKIRCITNRSADSTFEERVSEQRAV